MKIDKQSRGEVIMNKKVQLNDMELNQVAGGGWSEVFQKVKEILTKPGICPITPKPMPFPGKPVSPIFDPPIPIFEK